MYSSELTDRFGKPLITGISVQTDSSPSPVDNITGFTIISDGPIITMFDATSKLITNHWVGTDIPKLSGSNVFNITTGGFNRFGEPGNYNGSTAIYGQHFAIGAGTVSFEGPSDVNFNRQITVASSPTQANHVLRKADIGTIIPSGSSGLDVYNKDGSVGTDWKADTIGLSNNNGLEFYEISSHTTVPGGPLLSTVGIRPNASLLNNGPKIYVAETLQSSSILAQGPKIIFQPYTGTGPIPDKIIQLREESGHSAIEFIPFGVTDITGNKAYGNRLQIFTALATGPYFRLSQNNTGSRCIDLTIPNIVPAGVINTLTVSAGPDFKMTININDLVDGQYFKPHATTAIKTISLVPSNESQKNTRINTFHIILDLTTQATPPTITWTVPAGVTLKWIDNTVPTITGSKFNLISFQQITPTLIFGNLSYSI